MSQQLLPVFEGVPRVLSLCDLFLRDCELRWLLGKGGFGKVRPDPDSKPSPGLTNGICLEQPLTLRGKRSIPNIAEANSLSRRRFQILYKASMEGGRLNVAVKMLKESFQTDVYLLKWEMQLLARVQSPYVIQLIDAISSPKMMLVMEVLEGGSLYESLAQGDPAIFQTNTFPWYKRYACRWLELLQAQSQHHPIAPDLED